MALNIKPLSDRVIVEAINIETQTVSGVFIPNTAKDSNKKGTVVAIGNGKVDQPMTVKVGDIILYNEMRAVDLKHDGKDYLIMREDDILAII